MTEIHPFTLKVYRSRTTWTGKTKRVLVHCETFAYPEAMMAEASKWDPMHYSVWQHQPSIWDDPRPPREDWSVDWEDPATYEADWFPF